MDCSWGQGNNACDGGEDFRCVCSLLQGLLPNRLINLLMITSFVLYAIMINCLFHQSCFCCKWLKEIVNKNDPSFFIMALIHRAYQWIMGNKGGLATEDSYGMYKAVDWKCNSRNVSGTVQLDSYVNVTSGDQEALKIALFNHGPVSVAIDASHL